MPTRATQGLYRHAPSRSQAPNLPLVPEALLGPTTKQLVIDNDATLSCRGCPRALRRGGMHGKRGRRHPIR